MQDGTCLESLTVPTPQPSTPKAVTEVIATQVSQLNTAGQCVALGLGTPGPADAGGRIAKVAINLAHWHEVPLADWLEAQTKLSTIVANDANCAGLGEAWLGAGRKFKHLILLTLGTWVLVAQLFSMASYLAVISALQEN